MSHWTNDHIQQSTYVTGLLNSVTDAKKRLAKTKESLDNSWTPVIPRTHSTCVVLLTGRIISFCTFSVGRFFQRNKVKGEKNCFFVIRLTCLLFESRNRTFSPRQTVRESEQKLQDRAWLGFYHTLPIYVGSAVKNGTQAWPWCGSRDWCTYAWVTKLFDMHSIFQLLHRCAPKPIETKFHAPSLHKIHSNFRVIIRHHPGKKYNCSLPIVSSKK